MIGYLICMQFNFQVLREVYVNIYKATTIKYYKKIVTDSKLILAATYILFTMLQLLLGDESITKTLFKVQVQLNKVEMTPGAAIRSQSCTLCRKYEWECTECRYRSI